MKKKINLKSKALIGILLVLLMLTIFFALPVFSAAEPSRLTKPDATRFEKPILLNIRISPVVRKPAKEALLSVQIANSSEEKDEVTLIKSKVLKEDGKLVKEFVFNRTLNPIGKELKRMQELEDVLGITEELKLSEQEPSEEELEMIEGEVEESAPEIQEEQGLSQEDTTLTLGKFKELVGEYNKLKEKVQKETQRTEITLNLSELKENLEPGDFINLKVEVNFQLNKKLNAKSKVVSVEYQSSLPNMPNWYAGDGHMHTDWSDGVDPPQVMAAEAKWKGLSWIAITDHDYDLAIYHGGSLGWNTEKAECEAAEALLNIPVMLGEELGLSLTRLAKGHYLAYDNPSYVDWSTRQLLWGTPFWVSPQDIINEVNNAGGFGIIAHPYAGGALGWDDWTAAGYTGLEVMNGGNPPSHRTSTQWDENILMRSSWVGSGNSDAHSYVDVGRGRTYCYIEETATKDSISQALREGRCVATNGSLVAFQVDGAKIGDTKELLPGNNATLNISWTSTPEFGNVKKIWVIQNDKIVDRIVTDSISGSITNSYPVSGPGYFRVFVKSINDSNKSFYAYTNPIFVKIFDWSEIEDDHPSGFCWRWGLHPFGLALTGTGEDYWAQVSPGDHVRAYIWAKKWFSLGYVNMELHGIDSNGNDLGAFAGTTVYPWYTDWAHVYADGVVPSGAVAARVYLVAFDCKNGTLDFDAFPVHQLFQIYVDKKTV